MVPAGSLVTCDPIYLFCSYCVARKHGSAPSRSGRLQMVYKSRMRECFTIAECFSYLFGAVESGRWRDMVGIVRLDDAALVVARFFTP